MTARKEIPTDMIGNDSSYVTEAAILQTGTIHSFGQGLYKRRASLRYEDN